MPYLISRNFYTVYIGFALPSTYIQLKCEELAKLETAIAKFSKLSMGPTSKSGVLFLSQIKIFRESLLFLSPSLSSETKRDTKPLVENAGKLGLIPSLSKCFSMVFYVSFNFDMADSTIQMVVDFSPRVFFSNYYLSFFLMTILTVPYSQCYANILHKCSQILVAFSTLFWPLVLDKFHSISALSSKVRVFTSAITLCVNFSLRSACEPMPTKAFSMQTLASRGYLGRWVQIFCRRLIHRWSSSLNCLPLSLSRKFWSSVGVRVSLRLQQSLKIGWAYDQSRFWSWAKFLEVRRRSNIGVIMV